MFFSALSLSLSAFYVIVTLHRRQRQVLIDVIRKQINPVNHNMCERLLEQLRTRSHTRSSKKKVVHLLTFLHNQEAIKARYLCVMMMSYIARTSARGATIKPRSRNLFNTLLTPFSTIKLISYKFQSLIDLDYFLN